MSISVAPFFTAIADSNDFTSLECAPDGNPTTHATAICEERSPCAKGRNEGEQQIAATFISFASWQSLAISRLVASGASKV